MKNKIFYLLLLIAFNVQAQTIPSYKNIKLTATVENPAATKIVTKEDDNTFGYIKKSDLVDVIEVASAINLPSPGVAGKIYVTKDNNNLYRWNGTFYDELALTDISGKVDKIAGKGLSTEDYTTVEKTKLTGIQAGATANSTDAQLRDRTTHTGTQAINTVMGLQEAIDAKINISLIGANNGVVPLDAGGKVSFAYLPASLMIYKGMWNPATNTPTLSDASGVVGWVYKASVDGTVNLGSGNLVVVAKDFLIHNGTSWEVSRGSDAVVSVNGQQGIVTLNTSHIQEVTNKRYQTDAQNTNNNATSPIQGQIDGKAPLSGSSNYIQNRNDSEQAANMWISGSGKFGADVTINTLGQQSLIFSDKWNIAHNGNSSYLQFYNYTTNTPALTISNTSNAATFSSTVTAPTFVGNLNGSATKWNGYENVFSAGNQGGTIGGIVGLRTSDNAILTYNKTAVQAFTGINDGSTLNNNITGTANSWLGLPRTAGNIPIPTYLVSLNSDGSNAGNTNIPQLQATLGINNGSTLTNNLNGTAADSDRWGGRFIDNNTSNPIYSVIAQNSVTSQYANYTENAFRSWLGLGSNAYSSTAYVPNIPLNSLNTWSNTSGFFGSFANNTGMPSSSMHWIGIRSTLPEAPQYGFELASQLNTNNFYFRNRDPDVYGNWVKFWHDGNFNPANYLPLSGGTLSGSLSGTEFNFTSSNSNFISSDLSIGYSTYQGYRFAVNGTGFFNGSVTASGFFQQSSDRRLKYVHKRDGDVAYFTWKDGRDIKQHIGYIAQEMRKQFPDQVQKGEDGYLSVSYIEILVAKNRDLEKKLEALENRINQLEKSK